MLILMMMGMVTSVCAEDSNVGKAEIQIGYVADGGSRSATATFELRATSENTPMPEGSIDGVIRCTVKNGHAEEFGQIIYGRPDIYDYEVTRISESTSASKTDDSKYYVTIAVLSDGSVQQIIQKDGEKLEEIIYTDTYRKTGVVETGDRNTILLSIVGLLLAAGALFLLRRDTNGRSKSRYLGILVAAMVFTSGGLLIPMAASSGLEITYDAFDQLPENYVSLDNFDLSKAEFTSTNENIGIHYGYIGTNSTQKEYFVAYHGKVNYGTANRTATTDAKTALNAISGEFSLRWKDGALLSDGTTADILVTVSDWSFRLGKNQNSSVKATDKVYVPIVKNYKVEKSVLQLCSASPRTGYDTKDESVTTHITKACNLSKCRVEIQVLKPGTDTPIDSEKFPQMLVGYTDLDMADQMIASGKAAETRYGGAYAEGIEMIDGFLGPVAFTAKESDNPAMQCLVKAAVHGENLRVSGDGDKFDELKEIMGPVGDQDTYYSGFISTVTPQDYSFYWTGSANVNGNFMATTIVNQPTVAVKATAGEGGSIEKPGITTYIINSSTTYDYTPAKGYEVRKLTVEGEDVEFDQDGGIYRFDRLYADPTVTRSATTGEEISAAKVYTIDVQFRKLEYTITTKVTNGTIDPDCTVPAGDSKTIEYAPNEGYRLEKVIVDGKEVSPEEYESEYAFNGVYEDHTIEVIYEKIPTGDITVAKKVTGALGDRSKRFEFTLELAGLGSDREYTASNIASVQKGVQTDNGFRSDSDGLVVITFLLRGGEEFTARGIPAGASYRVTESASDHIASYRQRGDGQDPAFERQYANNDVSGYEISTEEEMLEVRDGNMTVEFTNDRPIATVTGVRDSESSFLAIGAAILCAVGSGLLLMLLYRRKWMH